ncbi:hypothetical protein GF366_01130, partial [Candidatus Peregrinibacteria bacterium]|nr:hypothetical protein [Candidatus Peregrinibacteria bacterium]
NIGPPNGALLVNDIFLKGGHLSKLFFENDLFFSGHTAVPFLAFLVFKESKIFKWVMFAGSILMAITVLLMHVHYSIDVFAAFFITYGIYSISNKIFRDLNIRFKRRVTLLGWNSLQKRIKSLKEKRRKKENLEGGIVGIPEPEEIN